MGASVIVAILSASTAVVVATLGYWFTKSREREADWRRLKVDHYRDLLEALSGIVKGDESAEGQKQFAKACNVLSLVASQEVLLALRDFQGVIAKSRQPEATRQEHDRALERMLMAIRRDLKISPKDNAETFRFSLWASGVEFDKSKQAV